ncbi:hypothetical protein [Phenylobacterium sp. SCN 70-31]|uniref:hypothetical protein n=1 Tax=Phenylobacterium sp. SCN 70-31 TaxID=1660129 RepID=UPI00086F0FDA|nr:hypothetical protein [Phenylobacterium sp. SCN 70-31]ODT84487.1 MAG: hypothetical protein ABS78_22665 [Phenylobacterium sp. SCN 70-31]
MRGILGLALVSALTGLAAPALAQTAAEINRLNQAIQICNSAGAAAIPECAQLNARVGLPGPRGYGAPAAPMGLGGVGGGTTAGILGALNAAMATRSPAPVAAPAAPAVNSQGVADCVRNAAGDTAAIQICLANASAPRPAAPTLGGLPAPRPVPTLGQPLLPSAQRNYDTATAIHQGGQNYHACVAANPGNWQACLPLLNGGAGPR